MLAATGEKGMACGEEGVGEVEIQRVLLNGRKTWTCQFQGSVVDLRKVRHRIARQVVTISERFLGASNFSDFCNTKGSHTLSVGDNKTSVHYYPPHVPMSEMLQRVVSASARSG